ncbi:LuxR C-terminal-related transcriptional regulator [Streptomyces sp. H10-C2]|uniref:ATP-binding protein n=1 Tax=unclassified Streptomyces TaxID=2593676 RepID=UPI0024BB7F5D|nr:MULTISPECIES: LuxR family transcriptional regulator [unclassified Streptomyces]MDJ0344846.1 LuxR C-terminal-related transcriptional regulator [Streptomyces sp. PH10-H1]MDJ0371906.1 LuxR C-terminal-related transcriptional regulator [Streptomyces sp. H10-C2]
MVATVGEQLGLRERDSQLAVAGCLAQRAEAGAGALLVVRGGTGSGRTALLDAAAELARQQGLDVRRTRCSEYDRDGGSASGSASGSDGGREPAVVHRLLDGAPEAASIDELSPGGVPLALAVDDIHLADPASRAWLARLVPRLDRLPVLLILTERHQYDMTPAPRGIAWGLAPSLVHTVRVPPLSERSVDAIARARLGGEPPPGLAAATAGNPLLLHALLEDLAELNPGQPPGRSPSSVAELHPGAYADAVSWWLAAAGPQTADAVRALAMVQDEHDPLGLLTGWHLRGAAEAGREAAARRGAEAERVQGSGTAEAGRDGRWNECRAAAREGVEMERILGSGTAEAGRDGGWSEHRTPARRSVEIARGQESSGTGAERRPREAADPARLAGWAAALRHHGFLAAGSGGAGEPARFAHALLRDAVLHTLSRERRDAAHRTAARLLHERGDRAGAVARHLLPVPPVGEAWAADVLLAAAQEARSEADGVPRAVAHLRRALDEPLSTERRGGVLTELGCLEVRIERPAGVRRLAEALRVQQDGHGRVRVASALGTALAAHGEVLAAIAVLRDLADGFAGRPDLLSAVQAATALIASHDGESWRQMISELLRLRHLGDPDPMAETMLTEYESAAGLLSAEQAWERVRPLLAQGAVDPLLEPYVLGSVATVAQWADRLDEAERLAARVPLGEPVLHPGHECLVSVRAEAAVMRGDFARLADDPDSAANVHVGAQTVIALTELDRLDEACRLAGKLAGPGPDNSWQWCEFLYARGVLRSAQGDPASALADFTDCGRHQVGRGVVSPVVTAWRSAAADCLVRTGRGGEAVPLAAEELRLARIWGTARTEGRALRALGSATGGRRGLELIEEAVTALREAPAAEPELIAAQLDLGRSLTAAGHSGQARDVLREAAARAERLGAVRLGRLARQALRDGGARPRRIQHTGTGALTASERRIADLAAAGHGNAGIAELLHLARRTVETHLTSTYRKLGIRQRADLEAALAAAPVAPAGR